MRASPALVRESPSRVRRGRPLVRNAAVLTLRAVMALAVAAFAWSAQLEPLSSVLTLFALWAAADGACIVGWVLPGARRGERSAGLLLAGAAGLAAAATAVLTRDIDVHGLVWLLACWALAGGVATFGAALLLPGRGRVVLAGAGAFALVWGLLLLLWPVAAPSTLARWLTVMALGLAAANALLAWRLLLPRRATVPDA